MQLPPSMRVSTLGRRTTIQLFAGLVLLGLAVAVPAQEEWLPGYRWLELGEGIFVVTRSDPFAGPIDGNTTVIVNDRDVVVVDSQIDPSAARAVIARIREITHQPVSMLVNSHWHDDHTNGNQVYREAFPDIEIVSHPSTFEKLKEEWPGFLESRLTNYSRIADRDLMAMADELEATDEQRAIELRVLAGYRDALLPDLATLEPVYPSLVAEHLVLQRGERTIEIRFLGRGNTEGDLVIWLPEEKVAITGDLVVHPIPYAFDAPLRDWILTLRALMALGATTYVPGHGEPLRGSSYIERLVALLEETLRAASVAADQGATLEQFLEQTTLEPFATSFAGSDPVRRFAWESFYRKPGLESAWKEVQ